MRYVLTNKETVSLRDADYEPFVLPFHDSARKESNQLWIRVHDPNCYVKKELLLQDGLEAILCVNLSTHELNAFLPDETVILCEVITDPRYKKT